MREGGVKCGRLGRAGLRFRQPKGFLSAPKLARDNRAAKLEPLLSGVRTSKAEAISEHRQNLRGHRNRILEPERGVSYTGNSQTRFEARGACRRTALRL